MINMVWYEWKLVEAQIKRLDLELERISAADAGCFAAWLGIGSVCG
jgi:transposase